MAYVNGPVYGQNVSDVKFTYFCHSVFQWILVCIHICNHPLNKTVDIKRHFDMDSSYKVSVKEEQNSVKIKDKSVFKPVVSD